MEKLNQAILYLEKSRELEQESKRYSEMAIDILKNLRVSFKKNISITNTNVTKIKLLNINEY